MMKLLCATLLFSITFCYGKYTPSDYVVNMHNTPPKSQVSTSPSYINSLLAIPLIIFFVSVLILVLFLLYVFIRFLKGRCCPHTKTTIPEISSMYLEPDFEKRKDYYRYSIISFFLFLFACFCANTLVFIGSVQVTNSLQSTSSAFNLAALIFFGLAYYANELDVGLNNITMITSSFPCKDAFAYAHESSSFDSYTKDSASFASLATRAGTYLGQFTQNAATTTTTVGIHDKDTIIGIYFASITIVLVFFIIAYFMKSKHFFTVMIIISAVFVFFLCILHSIILFALHFISDGCIAPTNAVNIFVQSPSIQQILRHYATCSDQNATAAPALGVAKRMLFDAADSGVGTAISNPLFNYLNSSYFYLEAANSTFVSGLPSATFYLQQASLSTQCLTEIDTQIKNLAGLTALAYEKIQCLPLAKVWIEGVDNGICTDGFSGMTNIWIVSLLNCMMLFGAMASATIFMPMLLDQEPVVSSKDMEGGEGSTPEVGAADQQQAQEQGQGQQKVDDEIEMM